MPININKSTRIAAKTPYKEIERETAVISKSIKCENNFPLSCIYFIIGKSCLTHSIQTLS